MLYLCHSMQEKLPVAGSVDEKCTKVLGCGSMMIKINRDLGVI